MSEKTHASRLTSYKNAGQGMNDLRRKRAELSVTLRKNAREEQLLKRRALSPDCTDDANTVNTTDDNVYEPAEIVQNLQSKDLAVKTSAARAGRRMLSREHNPPITAMVQAGIVAPLVAALDIFDCSDLQFEAAWALTNIASGTRDHTMAVVNGGAIPKLISLLTHGGVVAEQAAWALGNIAGDGAATRDAVLVAGLLPAMLLYMTKDTPSTQLRTNVWVYSNLCRNKNPMVNFELVSPALPFISELLTVADPDVLADACWALSYLTDGPNERIEAVQGQPRLTSRLISLLAHNAHAVKTPALRALGNMLTGSDVQTDRCIDEGCLDHIIDLLKCNKPALVKEAAWAASNILAGTHPQIKRALDMDILTPLLAVLAQGEPKCQKEAAWSITNLCLGGTAEQLDTLLSAGFLEPYCALLWSFDQRVVVLVLDGLSHLLQAAVKYGQLEPLCLKLEQVGALDQIEKLQRHENEQVYKKTVHLLDTYFSEAEDDDTQPAQNDKEFQFGSTKDKSNFNF